MSDSTYLWLGFVCNTALWSWLAYEVVKKFGWQGLLVKLALVIDSLVWIAIVELALLHYLGPAACKRYAQSHSIMLASLVIALAWAYLMVSDRMMRLWMMPPVKWSLYSLAAIFLALASFGLIVGH